MAARVTLAPDAGLGDSGLAADHGMDVSDPGRLPASIVVRYQDPPSMR